MSPRERPILFSAPMVRALLDGRKTQTRRALRPGAPRPAAYAAPGDRLWVKERWCVARRYDGLTPSALPHDVAVQYLADAAPADGAGRVRASLHLPRRLSRLTLLVTDVRVEPLQAISAADARAEGLPPDLLAHAGGQPVAAYRLLWERINGAGSWQANPDVWVLRFQPAGRPG